MSLESSIQENTEVMRTLISVLTAQSLGIAPPPSSTPPPEQQPVNRPEPPAKTETKTQQQSPEKADAETRSSDEIEYGKVRAAILEISKTQGSEAAKVILRKYGVESGLKLTRDQYAPALADIAAAMGSAN